MDLEAAKNLTPEEIVRLFGRLQDELAGTKTQLADTQVRTETELSELKGRLAAAQSVAKKESAEATLKDAEISKLKDELQEKRRIIEWFKKQLYGPRSERRAWDVLDAEDQLWLEGMALELPTELPPPKTTVKTHERKRRKKLNLVDDHSQLRFDERATVVEFEVPDPELEGVPEDDLVVIGEKTVHKLVQLSSPYVVVKFIRKTRKNKLTQKLSTPALPSSLQVLERSSLDVSFLVGMLISKFLLHLPLYRQHQWLERSGIFLDRGNLTRVVHRLGELLEPIYEALMSSVLQSAVLTADETPTPVGKKNGRTGQGYFWVFYGDHHEVFFLFSPSRGQEVLDHVLEDFSGHLLCDGHSAYESYTKSVENSILCQCWSHSRRNFLEAEKMEPKKTKSVVDQMRAIYAVEDEARDKSSAERLALRQEKSKPLVEGLFKFLEETVETATLLPSNPFLKAANYMIERKTELQVFLSNPEIPIDTNHVERELRPQAVGRKNWLFHDTEIGARYAAIFYSLIRSCILAKVDPTIYLMDVFQRIAFHPARETHLLTPRLWKERFAGDSLGSISQKLISRPPP